MAITIVTAPTAVGNNSDDVFVFSSNNTSINGFKFIIDIIVPGMMFWGQPKLRLFIPPVVGTNQCYLNISEIIRDIVTIQLPNLFPSTTYILAETGRAGKRVFIEVGEAYFTTPTTYSLFPNLANTNAYMYVFSYFKIEDVQSNYSTGGVDRRKLTKYFHVPFNSLWCNLVADGVNLSSGEIYYEILFPAAAQILNPQLPQYLPVSVNNLLFNAMIGTTKDVALSLGFYDLVSNYSSDNTFIIYQYDDHVNKNVVIGLEYKIVRCLKNDGLMLYWVNSNGQIDSWYFPVFKVTKNANKTEIILNKSKNYSDGFRFGDTYYSRADYQIKATSTMIDNDADMEGIADLFTSKYVWFNTFDNPNLQRCHSVEKGVEIKKYRTDKIYQIPVTINVGYSITV
jgi:hypothetical protein